MSRTAEYAPREVTGRMLDRWETFIASIIIDPRDGGPTRPLVLASDQPLG